jgi:hypothetical protein
MFAIIELIKAAETSSMGVSVFFMLFCSRPVSRFLYGSRLCERFGNRFPSFISTMHYCIAHTTYPPALDEQSLKPVYMVFQPIRRTARNVAITAGELLPHLFTLTLRYPWRYRDRAVIFCYTTIPSRISSR